jgi:putative tryptophan/tyrosine transport system substrate-binding protein
VKIKRIAMFSRGLGEAGHGVGQKVAIDESHARYIAARPAEAGDKPGLDRIECVSARLGAKRLELLRELRPHVALIALLTNPNSPDALEELSDIQAAARAVGQRLLVLRAANDRDIDTAFAALVEQRAEALMVGSDPFLFQRSDQIVALAARHAVPAIYQTDEEASSGGLMSYGASIPEAWHLAGLYAAKILEGETAANLPVQQSTKVQLTINLKTAKALALAVPQSILIRADEVIE